MAKNTSILSLIKELEKGILISNDRVQKKLNVLEVNVLRLKTKELTALRRIIENDATVVDSFISDSVEMAKDNGDGTSDLPPLPLEKIKQVGVLIGKTPRTGYDLGSIDLPAIVRRLALIKEHYKQAGTQSPATQDQNILIDGVILMAQKINAISDKGLKDLSSLDKIDESTLIQLLESSDGSITYSLDASSKVVTAMRTGKGKVRYSFDLMYKNAIKGELQKLLGDKFSTLFKNKHKIKKDAVSILTTKMLSKVDPTRITASPSTIDMIKMDLDNVFHNRKKSANKSTTSVRISRRIPSKRGVSKTLAKTVKKQLKALSTYAIAKRNKKRFIMPTVTLKAIINKSLSDFIQNKMNNALSPSSKQYLRNQTGRFADSAILLTLNREETGSYRGVYTFMREPYSIFEPESGSRVSSPGRDPKLYIEGAAREIAIRVLKKKFKGLILEVK